MDVTVVVATFGAREWVDLAERRAIPSAERLDVPVIHSHGDTLEDARNWALGLVTTEFVCYLDADDELHVGYFDRMAQSEADVRAPSVQYIRNKFASVPKMPQVVGHRHQCDADCLPYGNWLVVGSVARAKLLRDVGGWRDWPCYEDWDLWLRCHLAGATIEAVPKAIYQAHVRDDSRNRGHLSPAEKFRVHQLIAEANGAPVPA